MMLDLLLDPRHALARLSRLLERWCRPWESRRRAIDRQIREQKKRYG